MARPVLGILALLLLATVQGASVDDPAGDVTQRIGDPPIDQPAVDIIHVIGERTNDILDARIMLNGTLPISDPDADPERLYSYLFIIGIGASSDDNLFQHVQSGESLTVTCDFHGGQSDLTCEVTGGDGTLRGVGASGQNITMRVAIGWDDDFGIGAIAHESIPNATSDREIIAQDFTDNALPYGAGPDPADGPAVVDTSSPTPWWQTPWIFALIAVLAIVVAVLWPRR